MGWGQGPGTRGILNLSLVNRMTGREGTGNMGIPLPFSPGDRGHLEGPEACGPPGLLLLSANTGTGKTPKLTAAHPLRSAQPRLFVSTGPAAGRRDISQAPARSQPPPERARLPDCLCLHLQQRAGLPQTTLGASNGLAEARGNPHLDFWGKKWWKRSSWSGWGLAALSPQGAPSHLS